MSDRPPSLPHMFMFTLVCVYMGQGGMGTCHLISIGILSVEIRHPGDNLMSEYCCYIVGGYITELDISWSHAEPHFFAHPFHEFCRHGTKECDIICNNLDNSLDSIPGRQLFKKSSHRNSLWSWTIFHQTNSSLLPLNECCWNICCLMVSLLFDGQPDKAEHWHPTVLQSTLQLIQCQIQTSDQGINKAF